MGQTAKWQMELLYKKQHKQCIAGIDEVGRGCWAGPIVAAIYSFNAIPTETIPLADSKLLLPKKRKQLSVILRSLGQYGIGEVSAEEIDKIGLQQAQYEAYRRAIAAFPKTPDIILLDGRPWPECPVPHHAVVKGDQHIASIAAASIMAKVYRDTYMQAEMHNTYPQYRFDLHVGYGTKIHQQALKKYGSCKIHRRSYKPIQKIDAHDF